MDSLLSVFMAYVPLHERPPHYSNLPTPPGFLNRSPRYGSPDLPQPTQQSGNMSDAEEDYEYDGEANDEEPYETQEDDANEGVDYAQQLQGDEEVPAETYEDEAGPSRKRPRSEINGHAHEHQSTNGGERHHYQQEVGVPPSIFGVSPRNEFTTTIGEWILTMAEGRNNLEVSRSYL